MHGPGAYSTFWDAVRACAEVVVLIWVGVLLWEEAREFRAARCELSFAPGNTFNSLNKTQTTIV